MTRALTPGHLRPAPGGQRLRTPGVPLISHASAIRRLLYIAAAQAYTDLRMQAWMKV